MKRAGEREKGVRRKQKGEKGGEDRREEDRERGEGEEERAIKMRK